MDSQVNTPALGVALLLPVGFANIGSFFAGGTSFAETFYHGALALEDFFHVSLHEENPVVERFGSRVRFPEFARQTCKEWNDDFDSGAFRFPNSRSCPDQRVKRRPSRARNNLCSSIRRLAACCR